MKITRVETISLAVPLQEPLSFSFGLMTHRKSCLVHITTDAGIEGWGESFVNHPYWALEERQITIARAIAPLLVGENPLEVGRLWHKMSGQLNTIGLQAGCRGQLLQAISGADLALWDILGKYKNMPIYELLGGKFISEAPVYASGLGPKNPEVGAAAALELGIRAVKVKVGFGEKTDVRNIRETRKAIGPQGRLMIDANMGWQPQEALRMADLLAKYRISWLEEPCSCEEPEHLAYVTANSPIPVSGGENVYCRDGFRKAFSAKLFRIAQPDVTKTGGISEMRVICDMAAAWGLPWAPHFFGNAIGLAATLHLFAALPGGITVELDATPNPLRSELLCEPIVIKDGVVPIPTAPGLGVKVDLETVKRFRVG